MWLLTPLFVPKVLREQETYKVVDVQLVEIAGLGSGKDLWMPPGII